MAKPKSPTAWFRRAAEECGGRKAESTTDTESWQFPDGGWFTHHKNHKWGATGVTVRRIQERYAKPHDEYHLGVKRPGKPYMDMDRLVTTPHAVERWHQMQKQAGLDYSELLLTLKTPERVVWSEKHASWLWVREKLAIPVVEVAERLVVKTVLWTSHDLWEQHPRDDRG